VHRGEILLPNVGSGSKPERLRTSICSPVFLQQRTYSARADRSESCQTQTCLQTPARRAPQRVSRRSGLFRGMPLATERIRSVAEPLYFLRIDGTTGPGGGNTSPAGSGGASPELRAVDGAGQEKPGPRTTLSSRKLEQAALLRLWSSYHDGTPFGRVLLGTRCGALSR
jgi:hypothetical protein